MNVPCLTEKTTTTTQEQCGIKTR